MREVIILSAINSSFLVRQRFPFIGLLAVKVEANIKLLPSGMALQRLIRCRNFEGFLAIKLFFLLYPWHLFFFVSFRFFFFFCRKLFKICWLKYSSERSHEKSLWRIVRWGFNVGWTSSKIMRYENVLSQILQNKIEQNKNEDHISPREKFHIGSRAHCSIIRSALNFRLKLSLKIKKIKNWMKISHEYFKFVFWVFIKNC